MGGDEGEQRGKKKKSLQLPVVSFLYISQIHVSSLQSFPHPPRFHRFLAQFPWTKEREQEIAGVHSGACSLMLQHPSICPWIIQQQSLCAHTCVCVRGCQDACASVLHRFINAKSQCRVETCNTQCKWEKTLVVTGGPTELSDWKRIFSRRHADGCALGLGRDFWHTHTLKTNTLLCALLESDRAQVDSYRMYRSLAAQGCKAPVVTTVCTLTTHWAGSGPKVNNVKPQCSQKDSRLVQEHQQLNPK